MVNGSGVAVTFLRTTQFTYSLVIPVEAAELVTRKYGLVGSADSVATVVSTAEESAVGL